MKEPVKVISKQSCWRHGAYAFRLRVL